MTIVPKVWLALTKGERLSTLQYAAWKNEKRPIRGRSR